MPIDLTEVRELFFEESFENLDMMESNLLDLEVGRIDKELINGIFRAAHSIKGGAGIFSFEHIVNFAHAAETLLDEMRNGEHIVTQSLIDLLLRSGDVLRMMLSALQENTDYDIQEAQACQDELQSALKDSMENPFADIDVADMLAAPVTKPATSEKPPSSATNKGWRIVFKPDLSMLKTGNDPINLFRELASNTGNSPCLRILNVRLLMKFLNGLKMTVNCISPL